MNFTERFQGKMLKIPKDGITSTISKNDTPIEKSRKHHIKDMDKFQFDSNFSQNNNYQQDNNNNAQNNIAKVFKEDPALDEYYYNPHIPNYNEFVNHYHELSIKKPTQKIIQQNVQDDKVQDAISVHLFSASQDKKARSNQNLLSPTLPNQIKVKQSITDTQFSPSQKTNLQKQIQLTNNQNIHQYINNDKNNIKQDYSQHQQQNFRRQNFRQFSPQNEYEQQKQQQQQQQNFNQNSDYKQANQFYQVNQLTKQEIFNFNNYNFFKKNPNPQHMEHPMSDQEKCKYGSNVRKFTQKMESKQSKSSNQQQQNNNNDIKYSNQKQFEKNIVQQNQNNNINKINKQYVNQTDGQQQQIVKKYQCKLQLQQAPSINNQNINNNPNLLQNNNITNLKNRSNSPSIIKKQTKIYTNANNIQNNYPQIMALNSSNSAKTLTTTVNQKQNKNQLKNSQFHQNNQNNNINNQQYKQGMKSINTKRSLSPFKESGIQLLQSSSDQFIKSKQSNQQQNVNSNITNNYKNMIDGVASLIQETVAATDTDLQQQISLKKQKLKHLKELNELNNQIRQFQVNQFKVNQYSDKFSTSVSPALIINDNNKQNTIKT